MPSQAADEEGSAGRLLVPVYLLGPGLREAIETLYGRSREMTILRALRGKGPMTLTAISRACSASERAIRKDGKTGWVRSILSRYKDAGLVTERDFGNRITYQLVETAPPVMLLREMERLASS